MKMPESFPFSRLEISRPATKGTDWFTAYMCAFVCLVGILCGLLMFDRKKEPIYECPAGYCAMINGTEYKVLPLPANNIPAEEEK